MKQTLKENTEVMKNMKHSLKKLSRQIEWISKYLKNEPATGMIKSYSQIFSHSFRRYSFSLGVGLFLSSLQIIE